MQKETRMGQNWRRLKRIAGGVFDTKLFLTSRFWKFLSLVYSCKYKRLWETHELDYRDTVHLNEDSCVALTIRGALSSLRAGVRKYRPEVYKSEKSKILKKIHKEALGKLLA